MKYKLLSLCIAAGVLSLTSCDKKLDVEPQQNIDATTAFQNDQDVNSAMVGCYSLLGTGQLYGTNLFLLADLLASNNAAGSTSVDRYLTWQGTFQGQRQVYSKTMTRDNSEASRVWIQAYRAINNANIVIANLGKVSDAGLRAQLEGEALFVRGVMHFELVRLYGLQWGATPSNTQLGVVIRTKPITNEADAAERVARATVADVYTQVINDLTSASAKLPDDNGTRADKFTALAFLSRVYLQKADYTNALNAANQVINSNKYRLNASVAAVFSNKNTAESIFEIQQNDQNNAGQTNDGMATFFASITGIGRGDARVPANFPTVYPAGDLRSTEWYYAGRSARPGTYCAKWRSFSQNLPVIRIAEMYLTRAECNVRLGSNVGATPAADLAQVRNTTRTGTTAPAVPTLADVLNERYIELAFEGVRIHDVRRLNLNVGTRPWNSNQLVMPIPAREVDATSGVVAQNPGY
ncbi:MAG TPA: RagB/SusD family nutrient uptake outer membrane protein [Chitinophagaceae bacterium]|nr:RagB/SusD family nutrient uptake outer membrane protein [Chitinophagaceae bacterium]